MGLDIHMVRAEDLLGTLNRQRLDHVHVLAAPIVAATGIALGILVGHERTLRGQDRRAGEVLRRDQQDLFALATALLADLDGNRHGDRADLLRHLFKHGLLFTRLFGNHALGMFDRLQTATSRLYRFVPGEEKIAGITRGNLKNIPYVADSLQVLSQNYLHGYNFLWGEQQILQEQGVKVNEQQLVIAVPLR